MKIEYLYFLLFLLPLLIFVLGIYTLVKTISTRNWVSCKATLQNVAMKKKVSYDSDSGNKKMKKEVVISYQFDFNGERISNTRICYGYDVNSGIEDNEKLYNYLKNAKVIEVFVNPKKPSESVLIRQLLNSIYLIFLAWIIFLIGPLIGIEKVFNFGLLTDSNIDFLLKVVLLTFLLLIIVILFKLGKTDLPKYINVIERLN